MSKITTSRWAAWLWVFSLQYFLVQGLVALAYPVHFSLTHNVISDLGNTVTSPWHSLMNISFIIQGLSMALGALLFMRVKNTGKYAKRGYQGLIVAGIGTIIVGFVPENTIPHVHAVGAALPFILGNLALLYFRSFVARTLGAIGLIALVFYVHHSYLMLGIGGMERVVAYPQTIWLIIYGWRQLRAEKRS